MSAKRFRIAFSFAGEKRDFVKEVADLLAARFGEGKILYDKFHEAEFAVYDLGLKLPKLYGEESDLIIPVLCPDYDAKRWTGWEWVHIYGLLTKVDGVRVMPSRFGFAQADGLSPAAGFIELDNKTPAQFVELILERLALNEGKPKEHYTKQELMYRTYPHSSEPSLLLTSPVPTTNNLPRLPEFFGRKTELDTIAKALLPATRTWGVLIDGTGGIGKTSLAIRAAEIAAPHFDRVLFVTTKVHKLTPDGAVAVSNSIVPAYPEVLNEIARLLGQPHIADTAEHERPIRIKAAVQTQKVLLILDNLENLEKTQQNLLFEFVSDLPGTCKAIVTSRRRTDVDARIIRLGKLEQEAALEYLEELSEGREILKRSSKNDRIHLYEETGGNPLLLRWIVGQLGRGSCRDLRGALDLCRKAAEANDPLEFIFGDLLETFTEAETKCLAALTYFTEKIEVKYIVELAGISATAAQTALGDLANRALVMPDESDEWFALVPMVADFLRKKKPVLIADTGNRLENSAYALIIENGFKNYDRFPTLESSWSRVRPALGLFITGSNERLQTVCNGLQSFLDFRGRWDEWLALNQKAEAKALSSNDYINAGWRAQDISYIYSLRHQPELVNMAVDRVESHWERTDVGPRGQAVILRMRSVGHLLKDEFELAIIHLQKAINLLRGTFSFSEDEAIFLNSLALAEQRFGKFDSAETHYCEALELARMLSLPECVATCTSNLADLAISREDWVSAELLAREALALAKPLHRLEVIAECNRSLAKSLVRQGNPAEALHFAEEGVEIARRLATVDRATFEAILAECIAACSIS